MVTVVYAVYFTQYIVADYTINFFGMERDPADMLWGMGGAISMLFVGFTSPILGAAADFGNSKKKFLLAYTFLCITATMMLYNLEQGMILQGILLFIIGNIGFEGAIVFYNGFLPQISRSDNIGKISGYGFAFGYVGSLISLMIAMPYANMAFNQEDLSLMRPTFIWAGLFFLVFSIPFFIIIKEKISGKIQITKGVVAGGYKRTIDTIKRIREFPEITKFLISYFVYIDGVNTVIYFSGIYASETLGFSLIEVIQFFAVVQASAISGAYIFGFLTDKLGAKKTINLTLFLWMAVTLGGCFSFNQLSFYLVGLVAGVAMGSSQSASRAMMGNLIPEGMEAEFYGFYALTGKFSAVLGPLFFGLTSTITGSQRLAVLSVLIFFVVGYMLMRRVDASITYKKIVI